jgi:hypothetical protein
VSSHCCCLSDIAWPAALFSCCAFWSEEVKHRDTVGTSFSTQTVIFSSKLCCRPAGRQVPIIAGQSTNSWNTGKHRPIHTTQSFGRRGILPAAAGQQPELSTSMPGRRPAAESAVVHVLLIDTFTHSGFYPAVPERSLSTAVSVKC